MEQVAPIASIVLSLGGMLLVWSMTRNVRNVDDTLRKLQEANTKLQERMRTIETETVQSLRNDIDTKFDGIKNALAEVAKDIAVLKDRQLRQPRTRKV